MKKDSGKSRPGLVHIGGVLRQVMKTAGMASNARLSKIWEIWNGAVGDGIAANAAPAAFKGKLLIVHAESSAWMQQLHFLKKEMIANLNRALGEDLVHDIKFKIGPLR